jgi:hypothetical protein
MWEAFAQLSARGIPKGYCGFAGLYGLNIPLLCSARDKHMLTIPKWGGG